MVKAKIDGFCECAECGKKIEGMQWYDTFAGEFICTDCKDKKGGNKDD